MQKKGEVLSLSGIGSKKGATQRDLGNSTDNALLLPFSHDTRAGAPEAKIYPRKAARRDGAVRRLPDESPLKRTQPRKKKADPSGIGSLRDRLKAEKRKILSRDIPPKTAEEVSGMSFLQSALKKRVHLKRSPSKRSEDEFCIGSFEIGRENQSSKRTRCSANESFSEQTVMI